MKYKVFMILFLVVFMTIGCSKEETSVTGGATSTGMAVSETTVTITDPSGNSCTDSDEGLTKETAGKVTGTLDGKEYIVYDRCMAGLLIEYYCEGSVYTNQNLRCPQETECLSGACR